MNLPSEKILEQKKALVAELTQQLSEACAGVIVDYKGISVTEDTKLRKSLREADVDYRVVKNTYLRFAFQNVGLEGLDDVLEGTTAIAFAKDELAAAKVLCKYAEENKNFTIKAGFSEGKALDVDTVVALSKVPGKEDLLGMLAGSLSQMIAGFARAINAVAESKGEGAAPAEAVEA
jgi:large subunit ribosomal protein L10